MAFYNGLAAEARGREEEASRWYAHARALSAERSDAEERAALYICRGRLPGARHQLVSATVAFTIGGADAPSAHRDRLRQAETELAKAERLLADARAGAAVDATLGRAIVVASWSLMCGELAADDDRGAGRLVSTANDHFDRCGQELAEAEQLVVATPATGTDPPPPAAPVEGERVGAEFARRIGRIRKLLRARPEVEARLAKEELVVMHLDAMAVRAPAARQNVTDSRKAEKHRLQVLRELARNYRGAVEQYSLALTYALRDDYEAARKAHEEAKQFIAKVAPNADELRGLPKDDYYVLGDEGNDLDRPAGAEYRLFAEAFAPQLDGVSAFLAVRAAGDDREALKAAVAKASAVIAGPAGPPEQLVALYATGVGYERLAVIETSQNPADRTAHERASEHLAAARKALQQVSNALSGKAGELPGTVGRLKAEVSDRLADLTSPGRYLARADEATLTGRPADAAAILREGTTRHPAAKLWVARAQAMLRSGQPPREVIEDLQRAFNQGVIPNADAAARFTLAWATLAEADASKTTYAGAEREFRDAIRSGDVSPTDLAAARAYLAYALAKPSPGVSPDAVERRLDESKTLIDQADSYFHGEGAKGLAAARADTVEAVQTREALVKSREAAGFFAAAKLPSYQATAAEMFGAAAAAAERLPYAAGSSKFGEELLSAIRSRPDNAAEQWAVAERSKRSAMERVARGLVSFQLGAYDVAAGELEAGLARLEKPDGPLSPIEPLFEADLRGEIQAYRAIAEMSTWIESPELAREQAPRLIRTLEPIARRSADGNTSPALLYALGRAHEEALVRTGIDLGNGDTEHRQAAVATYKAVSDRLAGPTPAAQYPAIKKLTAEALSRFEKPSIFLERASSLRDEYRLAEAEAAIRDGVAHHPANQALWRTLVRTRVERMSADPTGAKLLAGEALRWAGRLDGKFDRAYAEGAVYEVMGDWPHAVAALRTAEAEGVTATADDRKRALAKRVEVQLRASTTVP